uniref:ribosomal protein S2 n=1 Tax=Agrostis stolonifera TaxID=63632 RepID=UPI00279CF10D|nr:ribosomal protein S2 [Agrostis stolonifera]WGN99086.1 ribosomal protein S2 [Agrostis stolonifera]
MASYLRSYLRNVNEHCFDDSQWKIGAFLTNSFANKKKFRSRKKQIHFGLNQQPDCVVILNADRKSSAILEADRSQIPIASLGDSTIRWQSYSRTTYTIPSGDSLSFVYFFCHSVMKTVIMEQQSSINKGKTKSLGVTVTTKAGRAASFSTSSPKGGPSYFGVILTLTTLLVATFFLDPSCSWIGPEQAMEWILSLFPSVSHILRAILEETLSGRDRCAPLGGTVMENETPSRSEDKTSKAPHVNPTLSDDGEPSVLGPYNQPPVSPEIPSASEPSVTQEGIREVPFANPPVFPEIDLNQPASSGLDPASPVQDVPEPPASPASNTNSVVVGSNVLPGESLESVAPRKRDFNQPAEDEDEVVSKSEEEEELKERQASQNENPEPEEE